MTDRRATTTPQEQADFLFDELSAALRHIPGDPTEAPDVLRAADRAFDALHAWLRAGNPLPQPWRCTAKARPPEEGPGAPAEHGPSGEHDANRQVGR